MDTDKDMDQAIRLADLLRDRATEIGALLARAYGSTVSIYLGAGNGRLYVKVGAVRLLVERGT